MKVLQECFHIKGYDASDGYISRAFDPSTNDSLLVELVKKAGAVIIVSSDLPSSLLVISEFSTGLTNPSTLTFTHQLI